MPSVLHPDPFNPILLASPALNVTTEQQQLIKRILDLACSDSKFSEKAFLAILVTLTAGNAVIPVITSLEPSSVALGDPSFILRVLGARFTASSKIIFNGSEEPTTFVSATELTTLVDMSTAGTPITVPVAVLSGRGVISDPVNFTFTEAELLAIGSKKSIKEPATQKK